MKKLVLGIVAHVDAGKTTLSEALLYSSGSVRRLGRVDKKDSSLDSNELERQRGITIFSKQARIKTDKLSICLLDTPGHVDFSAETERTLSVLDMAVLVISGTDGVQAHTETLWKLLERYNIPTFIFVTKMDIGTADKTRVLERLKTRLSDNCIELSDDFSESLSMCDEEALESYMEQGRLADAEASRLIFERKAFPVLFGSGLKLLGISELLNAIERFTPEKSYPDEFSARVYKILRDYKGNRLSCMKLTGGRLRTRDIINGEKVTEIRLYSGSKFETVDEVSAGEVCAVKGLSNTYSGQGLGSDPESGAPVLEPVLSYRIGLPKGTNAHSVLPKLRQLEDEDPMLKILWNEQLKEIRVQLMGEVQTEVLRDIIKDRFELDVTIDKGGIMYKETVASSVEGVGHYEPLRHYAEAHIAIIPLKRGSGIVFSADCPDELLSREWQAHIISQLKAKEHLGVLTGSPLTDVELRLIAGRAHLKHTEGGDFREASHRAVRQGLMKAKSVLLEPWYEFEIELPPEQIGRAISDIRAKSGEFETDGSTVIKGFAPVSELLDYASELYSYSSGKGRISLRLSGYRECHNAAEVIDKIGYKPESDLENSPDSVFCAHGAAVSIKWNEVEENMHVYTGFGRERAEQKTYIPRQTSIDDRELEAIMEREFGPIKRRMYTKTELSGLSEREIAPQRTEYLIVDGYNLIFADKKLSELAKERLELVRLRLEDMLKSYRAFRGCELVLVYDGYKVEGNRGEKEQSGIKLVFTKENETADMYIEKLANEIGLNYSVKVVTNDSLIRLSALRSGVLRMSSTEFLNELEFTKKQIAEYCDGKE